MFLFIDDERDPSFIPQDILQNIISQHGQPIIARSVQECIDIAYKTHPTFISFDHDLGANPITGKSETVIEFLNPFLYHCINNNLPIPNFSIHSQNPVGTTNISSLIHSAKKALQMP
ncbi:MAG: hypothetical protein E6R04_05655 [Spirochaetes bacterium]|nr:MAG: hypothetical protein E6R04_05655 [Spirochaetota bacterium]